MEVRQSLYQELNALFGEIDLLQVETGHLFSRPSKALNVAERERIIIYCDHHHRDARRCRDERCHCRLIDREGDVDFSTNELLNCPGVTSGLLRRVDEIQTKILALNVSKLT